MMTGLEATEAPLTLPVVRLTNGHPPYVLAACSRVAERADWSLRRWREFRASAQACLTPDALPEEHAKFLAVVRSYFTVELAPGFTPDTQFQESTHDDD